MWIVNKQEAQMNKPKITHVLASGKELDTVKNYLVKRTEKTEEVYLILLEA